MTSHTRRRHRSTRRRRREKSGVSYSTKTTPSPPNQAPSGNTDLILPSTNLGKKLEKSIAPNRSLDSSPTPPPQIHRSTRKSHTPKGNSSPQRQKTPPPEQTTKTTTATAALQTSTILTSYLEPIRSYIHRTTRKIRFPYPSGAGKATGGEGEPASSTPERFAALIASLFTVAPGKNEKGDEVYSVPQSF